MKKKNLFNHYNPSLLYKIFTHKIVTVIESNKLQNCLLISIYPYTFMIKNRNDPTLHIIFIVKQLLFFHVLGKYFPPVLLNSFLIMKSFFFFSFRSILITSQGKNFIA